MARPQNRPVPEAQDPSPEGRRRRPSQAGPGPALWLVPIGVLLAGGVVVGSRLLVRPAAAPVSAPPPPSEPLPAAEQVDPFATVPKGSASLPRRTGGAAGRGSSAFAAARRLTAEPEWRAAVDDAERGFQLLEEGGRLQTSGGDWRTPVKEAQELLRRALEATEPIEERLLADPAQAELARQLAEEREVWRRREYGVHKLIRG